MTSSKTNITDKPLIIRDQTYQWIELTLSILILSVLMLFSYTELFLKPVLYFAINWHTGAVTNVEANAIGYLQIDDRILSINGVQPNQINKSIGENPLIQTEEGELLNILLIRDGKEMLIKYPKPFQGEQPLLQIVSGDWILPYPFFAAGIIAILFIRPRTATRLLLILFLYAFALWISAGLISSTGYWAAATVMRVFIWLSLPVAFQLHWRFPIPFKFSKKWINISAYSVFLLFAAIEIIMPNISNLYLIPFLITLISSFTMLIIKYIRFKEHRKISKSLLFAYLLAILPLVLMAISMLIGSISLKGNIALLGLTAIPGFYFFIGYRIHMKREIPNVDYAQRLFTIGISLAFLINFVFQSLQTVNINPHISNAVSILTILFISLTGFGALLIMPALANDQVNLYKTESYTLRLSANRTAAFIIYLLILTPIAFVSNLLIRNYVNSQIGIILLLTAGNITAIALTALFYKDFRKLFERIALGILRPPEELIRSYAHNISTSLERDSLAALLKNEILPSLLIRESVLFYIQDNQVISLFKTGLSDTEVSQIRNLISLKDSCPIDELLENPKTDFSWVRVALPLTVKGECMGIWCFGRKDPNDIYNQDFIKDLGSLANQTTLALLNIQQTELLIRLYNANVNRQEEENANLARDLHDVLLPSIGYLVELQSNHCSSDEFEETVQRINNMIRDLMSGLRPTTLDMGLAIALEELADEPIALIGGEINIQTQLTAPEPINYQKQAELHLFRMVQQASQNALKHAQANEILIHGTLLPDSLDLHVKDDGVGFSITAIPDLSTLIANKHFGLANIFERAKIINADVRIDSQINQGTTIHIFWTPKNFPETE